MPTESFTISVPASPTESSNTIPQKISPSKEPLARPLGEATAETPHPENSMDKLTMDELKELRRKIDEAISDREDTNKEQELLAEDRVLTLGTEEEILELLKKNSALIYDKRMHTRFDDNKEFILKSYKAGYDSDVLLGEQLENDQEFLKVLAGMGDYEILRYVGNDLQTNKEFALEIIRALPENKRSFVRFLAPFSRDENFKREAKELGVGENSYMD